MDDVKKLTKLIKKSRFVFVCGNGGSASTAEHFTNDLFSKGIKAICLNSNVSIMTMIANDFGYAKVFSKQLGIYGNELDLLITISCSGTSPNILEIQKTAMYLNMPTCIFEIFKGKDKDYGKLENAHLKLIHQVKDLL